MTSKNQERSFEDRRENGDGANAQEGAQPLKADATEPQKASGPGDQGGADLMLEQTRGRVFGDTTSSTGGANVGGFHGRDGGARGEAAASLPNNPAPSEEAIEGSDDSAEEEESELVKDARNRAEKEPKKL